MEFLFYPKSTKIKNVSIKWPESLSRTEPESLNRTEPELNQNH